MALLSILRDNDDRQCEPSTQPDCFPDLHLDQIVDAITRPRQEYNLKPLFWSPLRDAETIRYRQDVMRDLEQDTLMGHINVFAERMHMVRRYLALVEKLDVDYHRKGWILEAALVYSDAVLALARHLAATPLRSRGLLAFRHYLEHYVRSMAFQTLTTEAQQVKQALAEITYCVRIEPGRFQVKRYEGEADYSREVEKTFEKFKQSDAAEYLLLSPERTSEPAQPVRLNAEDVIRDLGLNAVFQAMARGDAFVLQAARQIVLSSLTDRATIGYRQEILRDCLQHAALVRQIYQIPLEFLERKRKQWLWIAPRHSSPSSILSSARQMLEASLDLLRRFLGSALMGVLYSASLAAVVLFSVVAQLAAIPLLFLVAKQQREGYR